MIKILKWVFSFTATLWLAYLLGHLSGEVVKDCSLTVQVLEFIVTFALGWGLASKVGSIHEAIWGKENKESNN